MDRGEKSEGEVAVLCSKKQMREVLKGPLRPYHSFSNETIDSLTFKGLRYWINVAMDRKRLNHHGGLDDD